MQITIYSTADCAACSTLTGWLDKQNIAYTKKVTDEDPAAMAEFMECNEGMIAVPFTVIRDGDTVIAKVTGFDHRKLKELLV